MSATGDRGQAGMTLLEALVVMSLTVLISGLIFPSLQKLTRPLSAASGRAAIAADLRAASAEAVRTGRPAVVTVDASGRRYNAGLGSRDVPAGLQMTPGARFVVHPDGSATGQFPVILDDRST